MRAHTLFIATLLSLGLGAVGCALDDGDGGSSGDSQGQVVEQPVFLQPVFELQGLDELPNGIRLDELHLGVGAIFLDLLDSEDGIAFANRTPFRLHFDIRGGRVIARAPAMTLPRGGHYQVSVQIEPQQRLTQVDETGDVRSLEEPDEEASLVVNGRVSDTTFTNPDDDTAGDEPAPLPWHPTHIDDVDQLQRTTDLVDFSYTSRRTVRFVIDEVELTGGSQNELVMQLQVGSWVEDTISPALHQALGEIGAAAPSTDRVGGVKLDLGERIGSGDGMDGLIGGMEVLLR